MAPGRLAEEDPNQLPPDRPKSAPLPSCRLLDELSLWGDDEPNASGSSLPLFHVLEALQIAAPTPPVLCVVIQSASPLGIKPLPLSKAKAPMIVEDDALALADHVVFIGEPSGLVDIMPLGANAAAHCLALQMLGKMPPAPSLENKHLKGISSSGTDMIHDFSLM